MPDPETCAACGSGPLEPHLRVAGQMGAEGLIPTTSAFGTALGDIVRCGACGHMQLSPMPSEVMLADAYAAAASEDYVGEEAGQRATARRAIARIERYAPARGSLLDVGCWVGFLLAEARGLGWSVTGLEPSEFGSRYAGERLGIDVIRGGLFEADLPTGSFQAVTMGDVVEHLTVPEDALARIRALLVTRGILWMALPDAGSALARAMGKRWWSVIPTHVQYFTRSSMRTLLARSGFEVLEIDTAPKAFTVGYYLDRIGGYSPVLGRGLRAAGERARLAERMWAPDFRDRMMVVARRA